MDGPFALIMRFENPAINKYSGISKTFIRTKSLAQNRKKQFLAVAY